MEIFEEDLKKIKRLKCFHPRYQIALHLLKKEDKAKNILDLGCGNCCFLEILKILGFKKELLWGLDYNKKNVDLCLNKGFTNVLLYNILRDNFQEFKKKFDLVILIDVFEHIYPPYKLLEVLKVLGKEFIIITPNFSSWKQRLEVILGKIPFQNRINRGGHIIWVNYFWLKNFLQKNNFLIEDEYHLYSKTLSNFSTFSKFLYKIQNWNPNFFAHSFGIRGRFYEEE